jgi:hypothetical protein
MTVKPFFYICVGLTLSLPLFYIDLAVAEFFAKNRATSTQQSKEVRYSSCDQHDVKAPEPAPARRCATTAIP